MNAYILKKATPTTCQPITCTRFLTDCFVGGKTIRELQDEQFSNCGCRTLHGQEQVKNGATADQQEKELFLVTYSDAWLNSDDIDKLISQRQPAVLKDSDDHTLAYTTNNPESFKVPDNAQKVNPEAGSLKIRYPWDLLAINEQIVGGLQEDDVQIKLNSNVHIDGHLQVGEGTKILPGVYIEGNVVIGRNCKIGPNCYIRGKTAIGNDCHIGQAVEVKNSIIMAGVSAGHLSYIGDSVIGTETNLGAGTTVANLRHDNGNHKSMIDNELIDTGRRKFGTVIGDHVHTGINTSIYPGRKIWPTLCTRPASVISKDIHE